MVSGVEIADQHAGGRVAQDFIHHGFAPVPPQEVARVGDAESPHVAVVSVLTPARFIGVNHRTGPDLGQYARHLGLALLSGAMHCIE